MTKKVKPAGYRVLVKLEEMDQRSEEMSEGGIITKVKTKTTRELEQRATQKAYVVDIGPTAWKSFDDGTPWASIGDCVLICKYSGDDLSDIEEGEVYRVINDRDIEAIFPEERIEVNNV
jgi:co-chaperonin GroES (HSP10)